MASRLIKEPRKVSLVKAQLQERPPYHHLWIAPYTTNPLPQSLLPCLLASVLLIPPTRHFLPHHQTHHITSILPCCLDGLLSLYFPPTFSRSVVPTRSQFLIDHMSVQSPADIGDGKGSPHTISIHSHGIPPEHKKSVGDAKPKPEMSVIIILANALILQVRKLCLKILCDAKKGEIFLEITFND